ncbi:hypothetical protein BALOs_0739 [Halobacteriovorax sp. BALOs_7]|uniref:nucleotidyltransferase domain-containing protein n=1 Tax=Halobacteriovorax sp. BALOs_7 TaxID=2109558 RepID=UPI000EB6B83F|nr:nucleotidyltransferase [Halobacteriovorax sp. BALOs_7]AYF43749.1 hypothetical protein BALOs_0739 [Halobacteriovorax sp. BALOs_7]
MNSFDDKTVGILGELLEKAHTGVEARLRKWAKPPSQTEQEKIERTERMVKEAIKSSEVLKSKDITVFTKGSYANRINIPSDSDVDVGVRLNSLYFNQYSEGLSDDDFGLVDATYTFNDFKTDLAKAIEDKFNKENVTVGSKAIKVHSNSCRVDGDVVALAVHRRYTSKTNYYEGVALKTIHGVIYNWPQQNYDSHVSKNTNTGQRHKPLIRIIKNLKKEMSSKGVLSTEVPSYLIECLSWNVPDHLFKKEKYKEMTLDCLDYLRLALLSEGTCKEWGEVNELKYLFGSHQSWTRLEAYNFVKEIKSYLEGCE